MTRTVSGLSVAAAFLAAASLGAQTSSTAAPSQTSASSMSDRGSKDMTVTGCLEKGADGNYILTSAKMDDATTTTGTSGSSSASASTTAAGHSSEAAMTWELTGGKDLDKHVGHKIQVTGKAVSSAREDDHAAAAAGSTATAGT